MTMPRVKLETIEIKSETDEIARSVSDKTKELSDHLPNLTTIPVTQNSHLSAFGEEN
jgi:hypothetical protein